MPYPSCADQAVRGSVSSGRSEQEQDVEPEKQTMSRDCRVQGDLPCDFLQLQWLIAIRFGRI